MYRDDPSNHVLSHDRSVGKPVRVALKKQPVALRACGHDAMKQRPAIGQHEHNVSDDRFTITAHRHLLAGTDGRQHAVPGETRDHGASGRTPESRGRRKRLEAARSGVSADRLRQAWLHRLRNPLRS